MGFEKTNCHFSKEIKNKKLSYLKIGSIVVARSLMVASLLRTLYCHNLFLKILLGILAILAKKKKKKLWFQEHMVRT